MKVEGATVLLFRSRQLVEAGRILDIPVYDHLIVGGDHYFSFAEAGLL